MDLVEAKQAIAQRFLDRWPIESAAELGSIVPYTTDNVVKPEGDGFFARLSIYHLDEEQATLGRVGRRWYDSEGIIEVRLSCGVNRGTLELDKLAGAVRRIFRGRRLGKGVREKGVVTEGTSIAELRRDREAPGRWILTCTTPFRYTDIG